MATRGIHHNAVVGTLATWTRRYCPFVFCGSDRLAADFAFRFLVGQLRGIERLANALRFQSSDNQFKKDSVPAAEEGSYSPF